MKSFTVIAKWLEPSRDWEYEVLTSNAGLVMKGTAPGTPGDVLLVVAKAMDLAVVKKLESVERRNPRTFLAP